MNKKIIKKKHNPIFGCGVVMLVKKEDMEKYPSFFCDYETFEQYFKEFKKLPKHKIITNYYPAITILKNSKISREDFLNSLKSSLDFLTPGQFQILRFQGYQHFKRIGEINGK